MRASGSCSRRWWGRSALASGWSSRTAAWDFGQLWVLLALGLFAVAFLIGAVYLSRIGTRLQRLAVSDEPTAANDGSTLLDRWLVG
jgi:uncharacterized membrane protein